MFKNKYIDIDQALIKSIEEIKARKFKTRSDFTLINKLSTQLSLIQYEKNSLVDEYIKERSEIKKVTPASETLKDYACSLVNDLQ